jgi:hypothetical protein
MTLADGAHPTRAYNHFQVGLYELAVYPGRIRERLASAFIGGLSQVLEADLPTAELRADWESIAARLRITTDGGLGSDIHSALAHVGEGDACVIAEDLCRLAVALRNWLALAQPETRGADTAEPTFTVL